MRYRVVFEDIGGEGDLDDAAAELLGQIRYLAEDRGHRATSRDPDFAIIVREMTGDGNRGLRELPVEVVAVVLQVLGGHVVHLGWTGFGRTRGWDGEFPKQQTRSILDEFFNELVREEGGRTDARDGGEALLLPVTYQEKAGIEGIIALLAEAQMSARLTAWQETQIMLIGELIRKARDEAVPDVTERWKVVGVVGGALRYLARELPEDVVKWGAAGLILSNIDWHNLAQALPG